MIRLTKGVTSQIIVTLREKQLINFPNYLFVFTGRTTNTQIKFVMLKQSNITLSPLRYDKFIITDDLFAQAKIQQYIYNIYEQTSSTNTDPTGLNLLETGIMELVQPTTVFTNPTATTERNI